MSGRRTASSGLEGAVQRSLLWPCPGVDGVERGELEWWDGAAEGPPEVGWGGFRPPGRLRRKVYSIWASPAISELACIVV